jgi:cytochrome P450
MEDTFLHQYFLKKDSTIMVVNPVMHTDVSVWGPSAHEFSHYRFLEKDIPSTKSENATEHRGEYTRASKWSERPEKSPACRNFGGGSTLCPGRHFATQEVLSLVAMIIMRFEVRPVKGCWLPPKKMIPLPTALPIPEASNPGDLDVEIIPREDGRSWSFTYTETQESSPRINSQEIL